MGKETQEFVPGLLLVGVIADTEVNQGISERTGRSYRIATVWIQAGRHMFECMLSRQFGPVGSTAQYLEPVIGEDSAWYVEPRIETYNGASRIKLALVAPASRPTMLSAVSGS